MRRAKVAVRAPSVPSKMSPEDNPVNTHHGFWHRPSRCFPAPGLIDLFNSFYVPEVTSLIGVADTGAEQTLFGGNTKIHPNGPRINILASCLVDQRRPRPVSFARCCTVCYPCVLQVQV